MFELDSLILLYHAISLIAVLIISGILTFAASQYAAFNFKKAVMNIWVLVVILFMTPPLYDFSTFAAKEFPFYLPLFCFAVCAFTLFGFYYLFEKKGIGCGKELIRKPFKSNGLKQALITFDDGPSPDWTEKIIDVLNEKKISAIFFLVGRAVDDHPDIVRKLSHAGIECGVHSYFHLPLPLLSTEKIEEEIGRTIKAIENAGAPRPRFFRPPWGLYNKQVIDAAKSKGLIPVLWSRSGKDWYYKTPEKVLSLTSEKAEENEIILLHDGHKEGASREVTVAALPLIIDEFNKKGYIFIMLDNIEAVPKVKEPVADLKSIPGTKPGIARKENPT